MFFRFNRRFNILKIDDTFARLVSIETNDDLNFEFTYSVSQSEVVKRNSLTVNVSVISRTIQRKPLMADSHSGYINTKALVSNILSQVQDAKTSLKEQETYTVAFRASDISAKINNEIVGQLRSGVPLSKIPTLTQTKLVTRSAYDNKSINETLPLMSFIAHSTLPIEDLETNTSASVDLNTRKMMFEMIIRQGIDPSNVTQLTHRSIPAFNTMGGLLRPTRTPEYAFDPSSQMLNHYVLDSDADPVRFTTDEVKDDTMIHTTESIVSDIVEVPVRLTIPRHSRKFEGDDNSHYLVKFDLIDGSTGATIDSIVKSLDVARHVQLYHTPRKPPIVQFGTSELSSRINLQVKQIDPGATAIQVYKKTISRASVDIDDYVLIGTYELTSKQQALQVTVERPLSSTAIYRIVPVGLLGNIGFEFSNIVVRPQRYSPIKAVAINAQSTESGVEVEIRQFPPSATSVEILVRNLSTFEKTYRNVGFINLIDDSTRVADYVSTIDTSVAEGCVYEYVARVTYESGLSELSGNAILEFVKLTPGKVDLQVTDVQITNEADEPNVSFNVRSLILDENIDVVLALLKRQDIKEYFDNDIAREREFLKSLIAHNVQRVELNTGTREDFGVIVDEFFDDKAQRKNNAVSALQYGKKYRYEIVTLLRAPETMFDQFVKQKVDDVTKKTYRFQPSKFLHPIALKTGTLVTAAGLRTRYSKDQMSHGLIGTLATVEASFDDQPARVSNPTAAKFNRFLNVITWKLEGEIDQVDHFLLMKDVHGVRTMIGKAHAEFGFGNCQYIHPITSRDKGELKYVIVPVFNDYRTGITTITNSVLV